jgi:hypothetical protein
MSQSKHIKTTYPGWLKAYVVKLQQELRLAHWNINFEGVYCPDTSMAEIVISPAQHTAEISLCKGWRKWNPSVMRSTIAHELMHCHVNAINEIAEEHLEELAPKTFAERKKGMDYVNERVTDALAEMVAPHLTLPKIPVRAQSRTLSHGLSHSRMRSSQKTRGTKGKSAKGSGKKTTKKAAPKRKKGK